MLNNAAIRENEIQLFGHKTCALHADAATMLSSLVLRETKQPKFHIYIANVTQFTMNIVQLSHVRNVVDTMYVATMLPT